MPQENQKRWTKLVKAQSRTTWAVLGVALVALLLAVWWVPTLASVPEVSFSSDDDDDEDGEVEGLSSGGGHQGRWIKILKRTATAEIHGGFAIEVRCSSSYQVKAIYVDVDDPDYDIDVEYFKVFIQKTFGDAGVETWDIAHRDFSARDDSRGVELLSSLVIEPSPVGVPEGYTFVIGGTVLESLDDGDDTLSVIAVLESSGRCTVDIDP